MASQARDRPPFGAGNCTLSGALLNTSRELYTELCRPQFITGSGRYIISSRPERA